MIPAPELILVDPTATRRAPRALAAPTALAHARLGLIDAMLNQRAQWGQGLLDAAEVRLRSHAPSLEMARETVNPLAHEGSERWASTMAARYEALVIATGD